MLRDDEYMARAFFHAERGRGRTTPNPLVGAVVVTPDGVVVGHGFHERAGERHAEICALDAAGDRARGATIYCTLEPCSHVGRTGPCVTRIVEQGVARVVAAIQDPNPVVSGRGFAYLREHGVHVDVGLGGQTARMQNAAFFSTFARRRPLVVAKIATSIDGRIAGPEGVRLHLTSEAANRRVHRLRASVDAVAIGSGTLLADDPLLSARGAYRERPLVRVILDRRLRTPATARIFTTLDCGPVIVMTSASASARVPDRIRALEHAGAIVVMVPATAKDDKETPTAAAPTLGDILGCLMSFDVATVLLEGGAEVHRAAWREGLIDRMHVIVAPRAIGDAGVPWLDSCTMDWKDVAVTRAEALGPDVWLDADVYRTD